MRSNPEEIIRDTVIDLHNIFHEIIPLKIRVSAGELYPEIDAPAITIIQTPDDPLIPESRFGSFPDEGNIYSIIFDDGMIDYFHKVGRRDFVENVTAHEFSHVILKSPEPVEELEIIFEEGLVSRWKLFFMLDNLFPRIYGDSHWIATRIRDKEINIRSMNREELIMKAMERGSVNELFAIVFGNEYSGMRPIQRWRINRGVKDYLDNYYENRTVYKEPRIILEIG